MNHLLQSLILVHETFQQFVIEKFDSKLNDMELEENLLIVRIDLLTRYQELLVDEVLKLLLEEAHNVPHKVLVDALVPLPTLVGVQKWGQFLLHVGLEFERICIQHSLCVVNLIVFLG